MTGAILVIWTVVAVSGSNYSERAAKMDWRPIGVFQTVAACREAARVLGKTPGNSICLPTGSAP